VTFDADISALRGTVCEFGRLITSRILATAVNDGDTARWVTVSFPDSDTEVDTLLSVSLMLIMRLRLFLVFSVCSVVTWSEKVTLSRTFVIFNCHVDDIIWLHEL